MLFVRIALSFLLFEIAVSKSIESTNDLVWFPNPKTNDGSLIPARLTPDPNSKLGDIKDIHYYLYTKDSPNLQQEIFSGQLDSIEKSKFIKNGKVKLLIHGFGGAFNHTFPWKCGKEFLNAGIDNIILVEWSILSDSPDYFTAVANAQLTSQLTAELIDFLVDNALVKMVDVHVIGFSLGGQVVGQIGSRVKNRLSRITALDPALPLFDVAHLDNRTDESDAEVVDVIHTSANGVLGFYDPCGTADFYPNGGRHQPGCGIDATGSCGHGRAPDMFTESINGNVDFLARECESYDEFLNGTCLDRVTVKMGIDLPTAAKGIYFLKSNSKSPFAMGPEGAS